MTETAGETTPDDRIVVGVDGFEEAAAALRWAALEAQRRRAALDVVTGWSYDLPDKVGEFETRSAASLDRAREEVTRLAPDVAAGYHAEAEGAADALIAHSEGAALLVVGTRRRSRLTGIVLGSVSAECARRAACPIVIVPRGDGAAPDA